MQQHEQTPSQPAPAGFSLSAYSEELWMRHSRGILIAAAAVVLLAAAWFGWSSMQASKAEADNRRLGEAYVLLRQENLPAAEQALTTFLASNPSGLARDKANLFLGKTRYQMQDYDGAIAAYAAVEKGGRSVALLHAGALYGLAAAHMQKAEYAPAAAALEELIKLYGVRTGDPRENLAGEEVADLAPSVSNALWKLALCRAETGDRAAAREAAERLVRVYPGSREARDAEKLLVTL